jgi:hypothetical protein
MAQSNKKTKYIIIGIVCFVAAMFVVLLAIGMIGGMVYYQTGGN